MCADRDSETKNEQSLSNKKESDNDAQPSPAPDEKSGELLQKQVEFHYMNFDRRRSYEWKLSLALWTALAAFTALTLRGEIRIEIATWPIVVGIVIVALHCYFLVMVLKANNLDKEKSWYYEKALNVLMHTDWETLPDDCSGRLNCEIKRFNDHNVFRFSGYWACIVEVGITVVLLLLGALAVSHKKAEGRHSLPTAYTVSSSVEEFSSSEAK